MAKILVAEDDIAICDLVVRALHEDGHELTVANDGGAALDALVRKNGEFDLLLTDVKMPVMDGDLAKIRNIEHLIDGRFKTDTLDITWPAAEGADGIALALAAGRDHPDVAIMLMTGFADQRERTRGLDALVHDVIAKPFSVEQIKGAVREALVVRH